MSILPCPSREEEGEGGGREGGRGKRKERGGGREGGGIGEEGRERSEDVKGSVAARHKMD